MANADLLIAAICRVVGPAVKACQPETPGMDWKTFIATMTGHVAWPLSVLVLGLTLLWLLRHHLAGLLERLQELTLPGGFTLKLAQEIEKGRGQSETVAAESPETARASQPVPDHLLSLAQSFPEAAILEAFKPIEAELVGLREKLGMEPRSNLPSVMRELSRRRLVQTDSVEFFHTLRNVRNAAAHANHIRVSPVEAVDYAQQTEVMLAVLKSVSAQL